MPAVLLVMRVRAVVAAAFMRDVTASTTAQRSASFPDVPTMREQGYDVVTDSMLAVFAPAGTPQPILDRLNADLSKIISTSEKVRDRLRQLGLEPTAMTQREADAFVRSEMTRWEGMIRRAGLEKQ